VTTFKATHYDARQTFHGDVLMKDEDVPVMFMGRRGRAFYYQTEQGESFHTYEPLRAIETPTPQRGGQGDAK
jgi:hypothetical protein